MVNAHQMLALEERIIGCRRCPRLVAFREEIGRKRKRAYRDWDYWAKPITGFGDQNARVLVIGLAPGAHGANRTGRVFTGDDSGSFLFRALHRAGFANQPTSLDRQDGLALTDIYISAVCRCVPPDNKPSLEEISNCLPFLGEEISTLPNVQGFVLLGKIAMDGLTRLYASQGVRLPKMEFGHSRFYQPGKELPWWLTSYHPSRQNTQTGRLTEAMFDEIWAQVRSLLR